MKGTNFFTNEKELISYFEIANVQTTLHEKMGNRKT